MKWKPMSEAPRDGTEFLGVSFSFGQTEYAVYYWGGRKPWDGFKAVYDIESDAPSPEQWTPIETPKEDK